MDAFKVMQTMIRTLVQRKKMNYVTMDKFWFFQAFTSDWIQVEVFATRNNMEGTMQAKFLFWKQVF